MADVVRVLSDPILAETAHGAVAACPCCGLPVVHFGDARVTVTPDQLRAMRRTVRAVRAELARTGACGGWALRARTEREDAVFRLTAARADEMAGLLEAAAVALDLDALLADVLASDLA